MKKQTSIYLSDKDTQKLDKIKEVYEADSNSSAVRELILQEYERINKYQNLLKETL